ncbi:triphosphoribosyl-dephospho-CoA synthase [Nocardia sp. NPDC050789]|uniref:triphosphoribosyl-dephospho-CoA synthase n=2 Tax=unclassified Nocardia TaxID=2637762 RepID=UPI0033E58655
MDRRCVSLADMAVRSLIAEAELTPKPGLVDLRGGGTHTDMDVRLLRLSAHALRPTFEDLAMIGALPMEDRRRRSALAAVGRRGEQQMMAVTGGVNTHRGAIWALGLAVGAAAATLSNEPGTILRRVARIAGHPDDAERDDRWDTVGARVRGRYRVGGAVDEARLGFPHAAAALAQLRRSRRAGAPEHNAQLDALMASMAGLEDTCLLARGGAVALTHTRLAARAVLEAGGTHIREGRRRLERLDRQLLEHGLSPGGSADVLALALLLDTIERRGIRPTGPEPDPRADQHTRKAPC